VPIALVSVGYQYPLTVGLVFKLAVAPALILLLLAGVLGAEGEVLSVTVFEAAMGPMIGASIVPIDHELDAPLLTLIVSVGIPLSFLTLPVWGHLLSFLWPLLAYRGHKMAGGFAGP